MAIGTSRNIAASNKNPGVTRISPAYPVINSSRNPGYMKERISAASMLNITNTHNVESYTPMLPIPVMFLSAFIL